MLKPHVGIALLFVGLAGCDRPPAAPTADITPVALHFKVDGMTCGGCAKSIESEVADLPGVASCEASFETGSLTVKTTDPAVEPKIIAAIKDMEFGITRSDAAPVATETPAVESPETAQSASSGQ